MVRWILFGSFQCSSLLQKIKLICQMELFFYCKAKRSKLLAFLHSFHWVEFRKSQAPERVHCKKTKHGILSNLLGDLNWEEKRDRRQSLGICIDFFLHRSMIRIEIITNEIINYILHEDINFKFFIDFILFYLLIFFWRQLTTFLIRNQ